MSYYEIAVRQFGTAYMYIEAETPEEATEMAERLIEAGTAQTILSYDGWDDEGVISAAEHALLEADERVNLQENAEELDLLGDTTD
jgi:hypothetical protein